MKTLLSTLGIVAILTATGFAIGTSEFETRPISLGAGNWKDGEITNPANYIYYSIDVTEKSYYNIWLNERGKGDDTKTLDATYYLIFDSGADGADFQYSAGGLYAITSGKVIIEVRPSLAGSSKTGTFGISYTKGYDSLRPTL